MDELRERLHEFIFVACVTASEGMIDEAVNEFFHYLETNGYRLVKPAGESKYPHIQEIHEAAGID